MSSDDEVDTDYVDQPLIEVDSDDEIDNGTTNSAIDSAVSSKKRKLQALKLSRKQKKQELSSCEYLTTAASQYKLLIDCQPDLSKIQENISESDILTTGMKCPSTILDALALSGLKKQLKGNDVQLEPGNPLIMIICSSASRCSQVIATVSTAFHCRIAKLFSKHMKVWFYRAVLILYSLRMYCRLRNRLSC